MNLMIDYVKRARPVIEVGRATVFKIRAMILYLYIDTPCYTDTPPIIPHTTSLNQLQFQLKLQYLVIRA